MAIKKNLPPVMSVTRMVLTRACPTAGGPPPPRPRSLNAEGNAAIYSAITFLCSSYLPHAGCGSSISCLQLQLLSAFIFYLERASHAMTNAHSEETEEPICQLTAFDVGLSETAAKEKSPRRRLGRPNT